MTRSTRTIAALLTALCFAPPTLTRGEDAPRRALTPAFEPEVEPSQAEDAAAAYLSGTANDPRAKIEWRIAAIEALAAARTEPARSALVRLFSSDEAAIHTAAMDAYFVGATVPMPATAQAVVLRHAWNGSPRARQAAVRCLGLCAPAWDEHIATILRAEADESLRLAAAQALARSTSSTARAALDGVRRDPSEAIRKVAERAVVDSAAAATKK